MPTPHQKKTCLFVTALLYGALCHSDQVGWLSTTETGSESWISHFSQTLPQDSWTPAPNSKSLCQGTLFQPAWPDMDADHQSAIVLSADETTLLESGLSNFQGNVVLAQGRRFLRANEAQITHTNLDDISSLALKGDIRYLDPSLQLHAHSGVADLDNNVYTLNNNQYVLPIRHAWGTAGVLKLYQDHLARMTDASYTSCPPSQPLWLLQANKIKLNNESGRGSAKHATLYFKKMPIFYFPYVDFPIDKRRKTGFLYPSYGNSSRAGFEFTLPFYWNLQENKDLLITPKKSSKRGLIGALFYRHLTQNSYSEIQGAYVPNDRAYADFRDSKQASFSGDGYSATDPRVTTLNSNDERYAFRFTNSLTINPHLKSELLFQRASDSNYFMDHGNDIQATSTTRLKRSWVLTHHQGPWHNNFVIEDYQTLHPYLGEARTEVYSKQPQWNTSYHTEFPQWSSLHFDFDGQITHFNHPLQPGTGTAVSDGYRLHFEPTFSLPYYVSWGYLIPKLTLNSTTYNMNLTASDENIGKSTNTTRVLPNISLDSGLILTRNTQLFSKQYLQTLEPHLYYSYTPYRNQNALPNFDSGTIAFSYDTLFRANRFNSIDRIGDTNALTYGIVSRLLTQESAKETLSLHVAQSYYFSDRRVSLCDPTAQPGCLARENPTNQQDQSSIASMLRWSINEQWLMDAQYEWSNRQKSTDKFAMTMAYLDTENRLFQLGYDYLKRDQAQVNLASDTAPNSLTQAMVGAAWPLTEHWRSIGRWHYDWRNGYSLDMIGGVEYNNCCLSWSLFASRYLVGQTVQQDPTYNHAIFFQINFKGLGSFQGSGDTPRLKKLLPGFKPFPRADFSG